MAHTQRFSRRVVWGTLSLLIVLGAINSLDGNVLFGLLPLIGNEFHLTDAGLGLLSSADDAATLLLIVPLGFLADRLHRQRMIALGVLVWAGATALGGVAPTFLVLLLVRLLAGVGFASWGAPTISVIVDFTNPTTRSRWLAALQVADPIGGILGVSLAGLIAGLTGSWRLAFAVLAVPGLALGVPLLFCPDPRGTFAAGVAKRAPALWQDIWHGSRRILRSRGALIGIVGRGLIELCLAGIGTFLPVYYVRLGQNIAQADLAFELVFVGALVGALLAGFLAPPMVRRFGAGGHFLITGTGTLMSGLCFVVGLLASSVLFLVICTTLCGLCLGLTLPSLVAMLADVTPVEHRSGAFALQNLLYGLAILPAGPLVGWASDLLGLRAAFLLLSALLILAGLLFLALHQQQTHDAEAFTAQMREKEGLADVPCSD